MRGFHHRLYRKSGFYESTNSYRSSECRGSRHRYYAVHCSLVSSLSVWQICQIALTKPTRCVCTYKLQTASSCAANSSRPSYRWPVALRCAVYICNLRRQFTRGKYGQLCMQVYDFSLILINTYDCTLWRIFDAITLHVIDSPLERRLSMSMIS